MPLGYDVSEHRLVINPAEAETVRSIFQRYLELGCVRLLKAELDRSEFYPSGAFPAAASSPAGIRSPAAHYMRCLPICFISGRLDTGSCAIPVSIRRLWSVRYGSASSDS